MTSFEKIKLFSIDCTSFSFLASSTALIVVSSSTAAFFSLISAAALQLNRLDQSGLVRPRQRHHLGGGYHIVYSR